MPSPDFQLTLSGLERMDGERTERARGRRIRGEGGLFLTPLLRFKFLSASSHDLGQFPATPIKSTGQYLQKMCGLTWDVIINFHFWSGCTVKVTVSKEAPSTSMQINKTQVPKISTNTHQIILSPLSCPSITGNTCPHRLLFKESWKNPVHWACDRNRWLSQSVRLYFKLSGTTHMHTPRLKHDFTSATHFMHPDPTRNHSTFL